MGSTPVVPRAEPPNDGFLDGPVRWSVMSDEPIAIGFHHLSGTYHTSHDWEAGESISVRVAVLVGAVTGTDPTDLPPLYDSVDLEAVERVLLAADGTPSADVSVRFTHAGCEVTVFGSGDITARPLDAGAVAPSRPGVGARYERPAAGAPGVDPAADLEPNW